MRKLVLAGLAAGLGGLAMTAAEASDAGSAALATAAMAQAGVTYAAPPPAPPAAPRRHGAWGRRIDGRWSAGWNAPGGWNGYYRPVPGWSLPSYWIDPSFYIADWRAYGLPAPAAGYGWSRYYDDAVLTDRYGRVADVRYGWDWDRYGGYDEDYPYPPYEQERRDRTGNTVAGAVVGGVIGGVAGNAIAGRGDKTAGTVLGAGVGAIAGAAIGDSAGKGKHRKDDRAPPPPYYDAPAPYAEGGDRAAYDGRWVGTWYGRDGRTYEGSYDGRYTGDVRDYYREGRAYYAAPPVPLPYAPVPVPYAPVPVPAYGAGYGYGYAASGYASSYAVDYVAPTVVTTTVVTEETTYAAKAATARKAVARKPRPRPRPRVTCCLCGC